jgi:hypothetical protein
LHSHGASGLQFQIGESLSLSILEQKTVHERFINRKNSCRKKENIDLNQIPCLNQNLCTLSTKQQPTACPFQLQYQALCLQQQQQRPGLATVTRSTLRSIQGDHITTRMQVLSGQCSPTASEGSADTL